MLASDPELGLLLAVQAARLVPRESAERALRQALLESRLRSVVDVGEPLLAARTLGRQLLGVTSGGDVVEADPDDGWSRRSSRDGDAGDGCLFRRRRNRARDRSRRSRSGWSVPDGRVRPSGTRRGRERSGDLLRWIARRRGHGRSVRLVDLSTGALLHFYPHRGAESAAISRDNRRVLTGGADQRLIVWSGQSGRRIHTFREQLGHPTAMAFSPDGTLVASASTDGIGRVWRTSDWGLQAVLPASVTALLAVAFSADGEHVVTVGKDGIARVYHADTGQPLFDLAGHRDWVTSAAFTGDVGSLVVTGSADGTMRAWDAVFQPVTVELADVGQPVEGIEFTDDGQLRVGTVDGHVHIVDPRTGRERGVERGRVHTRRAFGPGGSVATIRGRTVVLRANGQETVLTGHRDRVTSVAFSRFGGLLATASVDHDVRIWNVATGKAVRRLQHNTAVRDAQFSPDGRWLVSAANKTGLWDIRTGENVLRLQGHQGTTTSATFDPRGRLIVTGGVDGKVRTYECEVCGTIDGLLALADSRLAGTRRELTDDEREQYLTLSSRRCSTSASRAVAAREVSRAAELGLRCADREGAAEVLREPDVEHLARALRESRARRAFPAGRWPQAALLALLAHDVGMPAHDRPGRRRSDLPVARAPHGADEGEPAARRVRVDQGLGTREVEDRATARLLVALGMEVEDALVAGLPGARPRVVAGARCGSYVGPVTRSRCRLEPGEDESRSRSLSGSGKPDSRVLVQMVDEPVGRGRRELPAAVARQLADECRRRGRARLASDRQEARDEHSHGDDPRAHRLTIRAQRFSTMRETTGSRLIIRVK